MCCVATSSFFASGQDKSFFLSSPDIEPGGHLSETFVFNDFGCHGLNQSPELRWGNIPAGTRSFAVTVYDPDAPTGSGWWHWLLYNIPSTVTRLEKDVSHHALPTGAVQGRTDFGQHMFGGACPPVGDRAHRYIFTVYALGESSIVVPDGATAALVGYYIQKSKISQATITTYYAR